jgi:hypothetical protein
MKKYNSSTKIAPTKPCSSLKAAKMKSAWGMGRKSPWVWVPFARPLPQTPPEPTAMRDWRIW